MRKAAKHIEKLSWIDEFVRNVRPYIFVRTEDNILIKRPNQATKINSTGAQILKYLLDGGSIFQLLNKAGEDKAQEIELFLLAVKSYLEGSLDEFSLNPAVETSRFKMQFSKYPILSEFALTYRCNLTCQFCYAGCNCTTNPVGNNKELTLKECYKVIETIYHDAKVPSISFTGGEPTLRRKELLACISYAHELGMRVNLITNGTLIDEQYGKELCAAKLDSVQISIEGASAETHDVIVGMDGAFQKSINALKILQKSGIYVHTNTTLNKLNLQDCLKLPEFVKDMGLNRFSMNLVIPTGSSIINSELVIPYSEAGAIIEEIHRNSRQHNIEFLWYSPIPMCMFNSILQGLGNKGCAACDGLISVAPNGEVLPCASYDKPVGNLLEKPFKAIWEGVDSTFFREKQFAHEICRSCDHLALCNGGCPLYWRNIGYQELYKVQKQTVL
ncbi:MAG: radical SAM protein [Bacteroidales bacterium]|nr:radical SAM protein [Bacteroidales bacterium]